MRERDLVEVLARQADVVARRRRVPRRARGDAGRTGDAARCRPPRRRADRARPAGGAAVAGRAAAVARPGRRGARGRARRAYAPSQLPGGDRVERVAGAPAPASRTTVDPPATAALVAPGATPCSGGSSSRRGSSTGRRSRGPTAATLRCSTRTGSGPRSASVRRTSGERFRPLGRRARPMLVADALRQAGVPASARAARPVVCTPEQRGLLGRRLPYRRPREGHRAHAPVPLDDRRTAPSTASDHA